MVLESEAWKADPEIQRLPTLDILLAFEDYSRVREREFEEQTRRAQVEKNRKERKSREGFKVLMRRLIYAHQYSPTVTSRLSYKNSSIKVKSRPGQSGRSSTHFSRMTNATPTSLVTPALGPWNSFGILSILWIRSWTVRSKLSKVPSSDTTRNTNPTMAWTWTVGQPLSRLGSRLRRRNSWMSSGPMRTNKSEVYPIRNCPMPSVP